MALSGRLPGSRSPSRSVVSVSILLATAGVLACGGGDGPTGTPPAPPPPPPPPPPAPVASVLVSPNNQSIVVGKTHTFVATARDAAGNNLPGRTVSWTSGNSAIASVSQEGVVTAVTIGTTTISATSEGVAGSATVTVDPVPVALVAISPGTLSLTVGRTETLTASARDAEGNLLAGRAVTWRSSAPAVATVSATGEVSALSIGSAVITATIGGVDGTAPATITAPTVTSISIQPSTPTVVAGTTTQLTATARDAGNNPLTGYSFTWTSSTPEVATVSQAGVVTSHTPGSTTISATSQGVFGTAIITVTPAPVAAILVSPGVVSLTVGQTVPLSAIPQDAQGNPLIDRTVAWTSSSTSIATVSATGVVTGVAVGSAIVTATSEGKSATATVTITSTPVASVTILPGGGSLPLGQAATLTAVLKDASGNTLTGRQVTWTSSDLTVVSGYILDETAVIVGLKTGTATITASSEGKSGSIQVTVVPSSGGSGGSLCTQIAGASVIGDDGVYLGRLTNRFDSQSIYNEYGTYGSRYGSLSVYNEYGKYGSRYSSFSAFNPYASTPPILVKNGTAIAYFTVNTTKTPYINPNFAETCSFP